mgnify:CR=1 FL=1
MMFAKQEFRRILVYGRPVDMRNGYDGLEAVVRASLGEDPLSGDLFVFINARGNLVKALARAEVPAIVASALARAASSSPRTNKPKPKPNHEWMEEKDPNLPKELCSLGFVLWVSFSLLSYYPVLRETYKGGYFVFVWRVLT